MSYEEVREEARALARDAWYKVDANDDGFQAIADAILSHPRIAVLAEDQSAPSVLVDANTGQTWDMDDEGFRRIVRKP